MLSPSLDVTLSPSLVLLSPSLVILSEAKNLQFPLRVNSAKHLQLFHMVSTLLKNHLALSF